jgi:hypothetical protein
LSAPVNDPFSCPNNSPSISVSGMAPQSTATNGPRDRELRTLLRNYDDVFGCGSQAAVARAFGESLVNKALRSLRVKVH